MRLRLWIITSLLALLFSGCNLNKGEGLVFFYDQEFGQVAEFSPTLLSGEDKPVFKELSSAASESGYALKPVAIDLLDGNYISSFQHKLPKPGMPVVITSFLYSIPELQELLSGYQVAVVGAAIDIPLDKLMIIGNGFDLISDEGRMLSASGRKINFIALKCGFQQLITDAFKKGAGDRTEVFEAELSAGNIIVPITDDMIVASYGRYFKGFAVLKSRLSPIRVLNYPGSPEFVDPYMKKRVEAFICYDFLGSFKSAILELASGKSEKKSFYSFDLITR